MVQPTQPNTNAAHDPIYSEWALLSLSLSFVLVDCALRVLRRDNFLWGRPCDATGCSDGVLTSVPSLRGKLVYFVMAKASFRYSMINRVQTSSCRIRNSHILILKNLDNGNEPLHQPTAPDILSHWSSTPGVCLPAPFPFAVLRRQPPMRGTS